MGALRGRYGLTVVLLASVMPVCLGETDPTHLSHPRRPSAERPPAPLPGDLHVQVYYDWSLLDATGDGATVRLRMIADRRLHSPTVEWRLMNPARVGDTLHLFLAIEIREMEEIVLLETEVTLDRAGWRAWQTHRRPALYSRDVENEQAVRHHPLISFDLDTVIGAGR